MKTTRGSTDFAFPASKLLAVLLDPAYQVESSKLSESVKEARFVLVSQTDTRLVHEVRATEYDRGLFGIDRKKTLETVTRTEWDLASMRATWSYATPAMEKLKLTGTTRIEAAPGGCRLVSDAIVEAKVPLIGGKIEGAIADGIDEAREADAALMRRYADLL